MTMQHFLLSAAARTLSLKAVFQMGEDKAYETFRQLRWPETDGDADMKAGSLELLSIYRTAFSAGYESARDKSAAPGCIFCGVECVELRVGKAAWHPSP